MDLKEEGSFLRHEGPDGKSETCRASAWPSHHGSNSLFRGLNPVKKRRAKATDLPRTGVADSLPHG
jgi:hypothetical protein